MQAEGDLFNFTAPGLLIVPSTVVHGFQWHGELSGSVIILANSYLADLIRRDKDVETLCRKPASILVKLEDCELIKARFAELPLGLYRPPHGGGCGTSAHRLPGAAEDQARRGRK